MKTLSKFKISTLAGVTKIDGNYNAGDYAYDLITLTNVETVQFNDTLLSLDTSSQSIIEGTSWSDVLTGTSGDDIFDSKGGNDTIDGLSGNDQLLIFEDSSKFEISTLAGVTKIDGNYNAGDYAYDLITLTNVETVQFNDTLLSLDTSSQSIIEGTSWSDVLTGTSGDDIFDSKGGNDTIDGLSGNDQLLIFEDSSKFEISTLAGVTKIDGNYNAGDYAYDLITLTNVETVQFNDTLLSLDTSSQSIIEGTSWSDVLTGTSGDDIFDSKGSNDTIDGLSGNDQLLIFELIQV